MDLPLDRSITPATALLTAEQGRLAGRQLEEWNAAYVKVESYFHALRVRNRMLLGQLVQQVLNRTIARAPQEPQRSPTQIAAEEMERIVTDWFAEVLQESPLNARNVLSTRGRMALLLADMPGRWQDQFLRPGPWPEEFVKSMRAAYLRAGPDFQLSQMTPRDLDLGPIAELTNLRRMGYRKMVFVWALFVAALIAFFIWTH